MSPSGSVWNGAGNITRLGRMENPDPFARWNLNSPSTFSVDETAVQEFVADLKRATFERRKPKGKERKPEGAVVGTYKLSRKTILNIVGVVKLILGKKVWMTWDLDLGKPEDPKQRYFTEEQLTKIITSAEGQYRFCSHSSRVQGCESERRLVCTSPIWI